MYEGMPEHVYYIHHMCACGGDQKRVSDHQELELQAVMSHPKRVLGTHAGSSARAADARN